ncbi:MAG: hypothetical protein JO115_02365 [Pseudonocardiales bacterium]|nr:hypothetical protein [Pseudonocardiales bacterium]
MTRYYLEVRYRITPIDATDEHTDAMMEALSNEPTLIDPDVGANLHYGMTDVCFVVESKDEASALRAGLVAVRSAARHVSVTVTEGVPDLENVMATVRPAGIPDAYLSARSGYSPESFADIGVQPRTPVHDDPVPEVR